MIEVQLTLFEGYTEGVCYCCHNFGHINNMASYEPSGLFGVMGFCDSCIDIYKVAPK